MSSPFRLNLPKRRLSYSSISLWNKSKTNFRKRYYENIKSPDTRYTLFGKEIEKRIYTNQYPEIPYFGNGQQELKTIYKNIPLIGYLDSFDSENRQFIDYKTSTKPWTESDVQRLDQLPFYSYMIKNIYGKVHPVCKLIWLETRLIKEKGLLTRADSLIYTGKFQVFERKIFEWERKRIKDWIYSSAKEISLDYKEYLELK